ncbi:DUF5067 domain-containing protein [Piscibacillus salipiscarius]|uniref:DUF5067 domain-containing protein n=1 Tax=Piscibacillus salipiscarius TaxID=299480 RepID=UPI0006D151D5|nr:DUF5067 domain-containing protein [Piscibacillus salipiscarius]
MALNSININKFTQGVINNEKTIITSTSLMLTIFLAACGDDGETEADTTNDETETEETNEGDQETENEDSETENEKENKDEESSDESEVSDTVLENEDYKYVIKGTEQLTGKYEDRPILAVEVEFTNKTDEPTSPWMALALKAEQETDTTVEILNGANGLFPDDYKPDLVKMGDTNVKSGATVEAVIGYEILYPGSPVILKEFTMMDEDISF